jgi:glycosyltransferase involved in cell wall biosynthesis
VTGKVRILLAIKGLEKAAGGAERVVSFLIQGLMARGHEIRLLTFDRPGAASFYSLPSEITWRQLGTAPVNRKTTTTSVLRNIRALRAAIRQEDPDIVIGFMHSMYVPLSLALIGTRIPFIASEHSTPEYYKNRRVEYVLLTLACLRARSVTALSEAIIARYPRLLRRRMVAVPNPVLLPSHVNDANAKRSADRYVLTVGRMDEAKDHATLIRAFALIRPRCPDVRLRIVGDGPLASDLEQLVCDLSLDGYVEMPGRFADLGPEYAHAHLFVLPSRYESFGMVVAEALSYGLPVVAFADCSGVNEIIRHDVNGVLVQGTSRVSALADAMIDLLSDPGRAGRLGAEGQRSVRRFDLPQVIGFWEDLLNTVTAG